MINLSILFRLLQKSNFEAYLKWLFLIASYSFLVFKLVTFEHYELLALEWNLIPFVQFWWLFCVFVLMPVNVLLESVKWRLLVSKIQEISLFKSVSAVLLGIVTGFFTPNRVGEFVGRVSLLLKDNRKAGVTLSVMNSLTQNIIMALFGIPACILFFLSQTEVLNAELVQYLLITFISLIFFSFLLYYLPKLGRRFKLNKFSEQLSSYLNCLSEYSRTDLFKIVLLTILRYMVFCVQFYCMLLFFGVDIEVEQALVAIPTCYLFVTFTPSLAFSEVAVRSSYAVLIIGAFSFSEIPIILAGVSIWIVNFVIPMLFGSLIMYKSKSI